MKHLSICTISLTILFSPVMQAFAAPLTNEIVEPSNNLFSLESHYVVGFTTATAGTIKVVTITFPTGFNIANAKLILASGIGAGTISVAGQTLTYAVSSPVSVLASTAIMFDFGNIVNNAVVSNTVSITTKDTLNNVIDGPTTSPTFTLTPVSTTMLGSNAVTNAKIANGAVGNTKIGKNVINGTQIIDGSITNADVSATAAIALSKIAAGLLPPTITINSANIVDGSITKADVQNSSGIVTGAQACLGKVVTGFDASGNEICKTIIFYQDQINTVDSTGIVGSFPSIAIGTDGFPVISYYDGTNLDLKVLHCVTYACSFANTATTVDSTGNVGQTTSIAIGTDGFPVISYYDGTNGDLKVLHCGNRACTSGNTATTVDSAGSVGLDTSIAIGKIDGLPVVSYYDLTNGDLKVLHCGNVSCTSGNAITTVDSTGDVGQYTSIAIGTDKLPIVSYYDATNGDLKVLHCGALSCAGLFLNTITTVDSTGDVGQYISIAIGTDGMPVVSYYDGTNNDLKILHCGDTYCSSGNTATTVDSTGDVGEYTSIAIGTDGMPIVSYFDATNFDLKLLHCGNVSCTSGNTPLMGDPSGTVGLGTSIAIGTDGLPVVSYYDFTNANLKIMKKGEIVLS